MLKQQNNTLKQHEGGHAGKGHSTINYTHIQKWFHSTSSILRSQGFQGSLEGWQSQGYKIVLRNAVAFTLIYFYLCSYSSHHSYSGQQRKVKWKPQYKTLENAKLNI